MQLVSTGKAAIRMAVLVGAVGALDVAAALLVKRPVLWCATIPALIPLLTPSVIFSWRSSRRNKAQD